jgi:Na+/proline symporter
VDEVLAIAAFTNGAILGVFFLGTLTRHIGERAALIGMASGLLVMLGVKVFTPIAWPWFVVIGSTTTGIVGWVSHVVSGIVTRRIALSRIERP